MNLSRREPSILEVVGIARCDRVPHVRKLALVAQRTHVEQLGGYSRVGDKVAVEQLDLFGRLVTSWDALRYSAIANVGFRSSVVGIGDILVYAWDSGTRVEIATMDVDQACVPMSSNGL